MGSRLPTFVILVTLVLTGNNITLEQALKIIGWMEVLRLMCFGLLPFAAMGLSEMYYAVSRIQVSLPRNTVGAPVGPVTFLRMV